MKGRKPLPKSLKPYHDLIERFLANFNLLCRIRGRNYIIRESHGLHEGVYHNQHRVVFKLKYAHNKWCIYGQHRELLFLKREFPLFEIRIVEHNEEKFFSFFGLYTLGLKEIPFEMKALQTALQRYTDACMRVPVEAFTKG